MTTYTTPHFATGPSDLRSEPPPTRTRPASAAPYRSAGVSNEAAVMADGPTPDWEPGVSKGGVPKAAIGALGAALVGGAALAIVLLAPGNQATRHLQPGPVAQAAAQNSAAQKTVDSADAAVNQLDQSAPAAGETAASQAAAAAQQASVAAAQAAAVPAPTQNAIPDAPPVADAPVARAPRHIAPTPRPAPAAERTAPAPTPDLPARSVTPPADVQPPAMQQTPDTTTVTPSAPATPPAPAPDTTPAPTPAPAQ
jgi:hypothetical protein